MADVFISYSRRDAEFVQRLYTAFINANRTPWIDWQSIPRGEDWWREIQTGIEGADTFLCIISENWLISEICHKELLHARQNNKRVLPLIRQQIKDDVEKRVKGTWMDTAYEEMARDNWDYIRHLNWVFFEDDAKFDSEFTALLKTLDEDQPHIKAHTRYQTDALDWERGARNPSFLMIGDNLTFAETWLKQSVGKSPEPTDLQREYIAASRHAEDDQTARNALIQSRVRQFLWASRILGVMAFLALGAAAVYGVFGVQAQDRANVAGTQVVEANETLTSVPHTLTPIAETRQAAEQEADEANDALTPIPLTLTHVGQQISVATIAQGAAEQQASTAQTQAAHANATLTGIPITLTAVGEQVVIANVAQETAEHQAEEAINQVAQAQGTATQIPPTLTQAAITVAHAEEEQYIAIQSGQASFELLQGNSTQALARMNAVVEHYPENALAYLSRGLVHVGMENDELAIEDYTTAIALNPQLAVAYYNRALAYYRRGDYDAAIEGFNSAIAINPQYVEAYTNRGSIYHILGEDEAAIEDFNSAITINPQFAEPYNNRGVVYYDLGDYDAALEDYTTAIALNSQYAEAYKNRGLVYGTLGDTTTAIEDFDSAIAINSQYADAYFNRGFAYYQRATSGESEDQRNDLKHAVEDWLRAEELGYDLPSTVQDEIPSIEDYLAADE